MSQFQIKEEGNKKEAHLHTQYWDISVYRIVPHKIGILVDVERCVSYSSYEISQLISDLEEAQRIATVFEGENNEA